jgi:hypothetical protein
VNPYSFSTPIEDLETVHSRIIIAVEMKMFLALAVDSTYTWWIPSTIGVAVGCLAVLSQTFVLYVNHPNNKAVGHAEECSHVKKNGGGMRDTGGWLETFDSRSKLEAAAKLTGKPFHWCCHCGGYSK